MTSRDPASESVLIVGAEFICVIFFAMISTFVKTSSRLLNQKVVLLAPIACSLSTSLASQSQVSKGLIMEKFAKSEIVPDVLTSAPPEKLQVNFPSGVVADLGNELTPTQVKDPPTLKWNADPNAFYTLCMTDPDAPSRECPSSREWQHWLIGNIKGNDISSGTTYSEYIGSGPPKGTGLHRYVFLVFSQPGSLPFSGVPRLTNRSGDGRAKFKIQEFADKHGLTPVAGNFYEAAYDDYVPKLYEQLSGK